MAIKKQTGVKSSSKKVVAGVAAKGRTSIVLRCAAPADACVSVAGTFNGWSTDEHVLKFDAKSGLFQTTIALAAGRYEYKFVVDGTWVADPNCQDWVPNEHGSLNSVIVVA
jgi:1,4-alpha-glucan branching enzyme